MAHACSWAVKASGALQRCQFTHSPRERVLSCEKCSDPVCVCGPGNEARRVHRVPWPAQAGLTRSVPRARAGVPHVAELPPSPS